MSIRCGNHAEMTYHATVNDVRACFAGAKGGEATYGDVILTDSENAKIAAGIRDMEREGILPRRALRPADHPAYAAAAQAISTPVHSARADQRSRIQLSPKGREIHEGFGGSPKQYDFIYDLLTELGGVSESFRWDVIVSVRLASAEIDRLKEEVRIQRLQKANGTYAPAAPQAARPTPADAPELATTDGIFRNPATGEIFKGQFNRAQGDGSRLYFKRLVLESEMGRGTSIPLDGKKSDAAHLEWEYAGGAAKAKVQQGWLMTREEAAAFGKLYGVCVRCHRDLTKEESIERAMGPVCAGKQGW